MATFSRYGSANQGVDPTVRKRAIDDLAAEDDPYAVDKSKLAQGEQPPKAPPMPTPKPAPQAPARATLSVDSASRTPNPRDAQWGSAPTSNPRDAQWNALPTSGSPTTPPQDDGLSDIARLRLQQEQERKDRQADLERQRAMALTSAAARANRGGLGLGGGSAALIGDESRVQDRNMREQLTALDQSQQSALFAQQDQDFKDIQRRQKIWDDELANDPPIDIDGDGIAGPPPNTKAPTADDPKLPDAAQTGVDALNKRTDYVTEKAPPGKDLFNFDSDTNPGTAQEPYNLPTERKGEMEAIGFIFKPVTIHGPMGRDGNPTDVQAFVDQDGNYWIFGQVHAGGPAKPGSANDVFTGGHA